MSIIFASIAVFWIFDFLIAKKGKYSILVNLFQEQLSFYVLN